MIWEPRSPGWLALGAEYTYLITEGTHDGLLLVRWHTNQDDVAGYPELGLAREVARYATTVHGPLHGQRIAESFENGWSLDPWGTVPATVDWVAALPYVVVPAPQGSFRSGPATRPGMGTPS